MSNCGHDRTARKVYFRAALWAALALCLLANTTPSWALNDRSPVYQEKPGTGLDLTTAGIGGDPQQTSVPADLAATLQLPLTGGGKLSFSFLRYNRAPLLPGVARQGPAAPLSPLALGAGTNPSALVGPLSRAHSNHAVSYDVSYTGPRWHLQGSYADVGARFSASALGGRLSPEEIKALTEELGTRNLQMSAAYQLTPGISLSTERKTMRNDKPGDKMNGATISDTSHSLTLSLGKASTLKAGLTEHEERWDPGMGKSDKRRRTTKVEFASKFGSGGRNDLRLGLTTVASGDGREMASESTREVHLGLRPTGRLGLAADYRTKTDRNGRRQNINQVSAAFELSGEGELGASLKTVAADGESRNRETSFRLKTALGGGGSRGKLSLQQAVAVSEGGDDTKKLKFSFTGTLGRGASATNLAFDFNQKRSGEPDGSLARTTSVKLDRKFGREWHLTADARQKLTGTNQDPGSEAHSTLALAFRPGDDCHVDLSIARGRTTDGEDTARHALSLSRRLGALRLRAERVAAVDSGGKSALTGYQVELPRGEVPEWVSNLYRAHEFSDARKYFADHESPAGAASPLIGLRLAMRQRRGGEDAGKHTLSVSFGRLLRGRRYLQLDLQRYPEATSGDDKGRPMDLYRRCLTLGTLLRPGLTGRLWLASERNPADADSQRHKLGLAVWGRLNEQDQVEASISRDTEHWIGVQRDRTTVSVLFARKVSEENKLHLKVGYSWGGNADSGDTDRSYLVSLGYDKPI